MASLNTSQNGPNIKRSYQSIVDAPKPSGPAANSPTYAQWALFTVTAPLVSAFQGDTGKESVLKVETTGEGELVDLIEDFNDGRIQFAFLKVKDPNTALPKSVLIAWCGEGVPERTKGYFGSHLGVVSKLFHGYHVQVTARSGSDLTPEGIVQKVSDASGSKYAGGAAVSSGPPPPTSSKPKPAFTPTQVGGGGRGFNPLGTRAVPKDTNVDSDGWGADAPPVTRSQLEKVESAYKPTKVNIGALTSQKQEPSRFSAPKAEEDRGDVVRGGYQPIGKVDIAALRRQAKEKEDLRPAPVKGAYEPVGKVDIAAIRARAQGPSGASSPPSHISPAITGASGRSEEPEAPKSLADRSSAFTQSERLTSLPKPKVANKFGGGTFTGTKAPAPTPFGAKAAPAAPVGIASRTFADEGGKTPAQIWAEKKARQGGGAPLASNTTGGAASPVANQKSGAGGGWQSGYAGKSWAPVQTTRTGQSAGSNLSQQNTGNVISASNTGEQDAPSSPAGGISSIRDRFAGAPPMGAPSTKHDEPELPSMPPPMDFSSKPNASRGIPIPGLPSRPSQQEIPAVQHQHVPSPPRVQRTPSPELEDQGSPVRIAMPVARGASPEPMHAPEERSSPPPMPTRSLDQAASNARDIPAEPKVEAHDPARAAGIAVAAGVGAAVGAGAVAAAVSHSGGQGGRKRALILYDYEKAEDNELELHENEYVHNIDFVDDDWWSGENERGETGLFPSNYVQLEDDDGADEGHPPAAAQHEEEEEAGEGPTATALYDYEPAEDNELGFPENATITGIEFPDDDWWLGHYGGKSGLFPANYVQLHE